MRGRPRGRGEDVAGPIWNRPSPWWSGCVPGRGCVDIGRYSSGFGPGGQYRGAGNATDGEGVARASHSRPLRFGSSPEQVRLACKEPGELKERAGTLSVVSNGCKAIWGVESDRINFFFDGGGLLELVAVRGLSRVNLHSIIAGPETSFAAKACRKAVAYWKRQGVALRPESENISPTNARVRFSGAQRGMKVELDINVSSDGSGGTAWMTCVVRAIWKK